jgi:hypothetical protein
MKWFSVTHAIYVFTKLATVLRRFHPGLGFVERAVSDAFSSVILGC